MEMPIPVVLDKIVELGLAIGWEKIARLPGCQEHQIDEQWWFAINPHGEPTKCSKGAKVPPYSAYIQFNGWPAGIVNAGGGVIAAGRIANESTLLAAIGRAMEKLGRANGRLAGEGIQAAGDAEQGR